MSRTIILLRFYLKAYTFTEMTKEIYLLINHAIIAVTGILLVEIVVVLCNYINHVIFLLRIQLIATLRNNCEQLQHLNIHKSISFNKYRIND